MATPSEPEWESPCDNREDGQHCRCWYGGNQCCACGDPATMETIMEQKTLDNTNVADATTKVSDIQVFGNGDAWQLLGKASSKVQGWMKSTKAMQIDGAGCLVQVTTQQRGVDGTYAVAEAVTFVPGVVVKPDAHGGRRLVTR